MQEYQEFHWQGDWQKRTVKGFFLLNVKIISGGCYDYRNADGILIHKYGPHIFRTSDEKVYKFLSQYTEWEEYQHRVLTYSGGAFYPMPINLDTVNELLGTSYSAENINDYFTAVRTSPKEVVNVKDAVESQVGPLFYDMFFKNYTRSEEHTSELQSPA